MGTCMKQLNGSHEWSAIHFSIFQHLLGFTSCVSYSKEIHKRVTFNDPRSLRESTFLS